MSIGACSGQIGDAPDVAPDGPGAADVRTSRDPAATPTQDLPPFAPPQASVQRLSAAQYASSIRDVLGEIPVPRDLEPDSTLNGFVTVAASRSTISGAGVEKYETAAYAIAAEALAPQRREGLVPCVPMDVSDPTCARAFIGEVGRKLFRRPLSEGERERYAEIADRAAGTLGDFHAGLEFALAGLLQSPHFLFRAELGEDVDGLRRYSDYEMASRLSYVLWNTTPDDELLDAAGAGRLTTDEDLTAQVDRLLASERAHDSIARFFEELLGLRELAHVEKNEEEFPEFTASLREAAFEETRLTVVDHFARSADYRTLFTSSGTFLNAELAAHYGIEGPASEAMEPWQLSGDGARRGLLGHASVLAAHAHAASTSAALRGRFVRQHLLCGHIPDPPPDVSTTFPPSDAPTLRERVASHLENEGCASCHELMDPIGLGLERFDAIGAFREAENGADIDPSGILDGVAFQDAADLGRVIAEHPDLASCLTRSLLRYALGEVPELAQEIEVRRLIQTFVDQGHAVRALLRALVLSPSFRLAGEKH